MQPNESVDDVFALGEEETPAEETAVEATPEVEETPVEEAEEETAEVEEEPAASSIDDLFALEDEEEAPAAPPVREEPKPAPKRPPVRREAARKKLGEKFTELLTAGKIDEAFILASEVGAAAAEQRVLSRLAPIQENLLTNEVERFKRRAENEDANLYKASEKEFNRFVSEAEDRLRTNPQLAATLTPAQVREGLEQFYERAQGLAFRSFVKKARGKKITKPAERPAVPPIGETGGRTSVKAKKALNPKTDAERETIELARAAGLSDEDIESIL